MKIIVIQPNKQPEIRAISDESSKALDDVSKIIDGWLEAVYLTQDAVAYVDEESTVRADKEPVLNPLATVIVETFLAFSGRRLVPGDAITGTMVIIGSRTENGEEDGEWHDVPQHTVHQVMEIARQYNREGGVG